jgi:hypothetical protein
VRGLGVCGSLLDVVFSVTAHFEIASGIDSRYISGLSSWGLLLGGIGRYQNARPLEGARQRQQTEIFHSLFKAGKKPKYAKAQQMDRESLALSVKLFSSRGSDSTFGPLVGDRTIIIRSSRWDQA